MFHCQTLALGIKLPGQTSTWPVVISAIVRFHYWAFYTKPLKKESRPPDLPINLRVLAESILGQHKSPNGCREGSVGGFSRQKGLTFIDR